MTLKERITEDMKTAMRERASARLGTIRLLLAACKQKEVDERLVLDDAAVTSIIDKLVKQRKDSIAAFTSAKRQDLVDIEAAELSVLEAYLPLRLTMDQIQTEVAKLATALAVDLGRATGPGDMGKLMGLAKASLAGQAEMGQVSAAVKAALSTAP